MKVTIEINCDGAAFDGFPYAEVASILTALADETERGGFVPTHDLRDLNGNKCGTVTVTP